MRKSLTANLRGLVQKGDTKGKIKKKYIDRIWKMYSDSLRTDAFTGDRITKARFKQLFSSILKDIQAEYPNKSYNDQLKMTLRKYEQSSAYTTLEDRLKRFTFNELLTDKQDRARLRKIANIDKEHPFNIKSYSYVGNGDIEERHFSVYRYEGAYIVTLNSPQQTLVMTAADFAASEYNQLMVRYGQEKDNN